MAQKNVNNYFAILTPWKFFYFVTEFLIYYQIVIILSKFLNKNIFSSFKFLLILNSICLIWHNRN